MIRYLLILNLSLLLIHEMDAIRRKEWKLFVFLKNMDDEKAYSIFTAAHLPLYALVLFLVGTNSNVVIITMGWIISIFLIFHGIIHWFFRRKESNAFNRVFSKLIIYSMSCVAVISIGFLMKLVAS